MWILIWVVFELVLDPQFKVWFLKSFVVVFDTVAMLVPCVGLGAVMHCGGVRIGA